LDASEKALYHQIHPAKLGTDIASAVVSLYLLWNHQLVLGLIAGYVPSKYKQSAFGKYVKTYMNRNMQAVWLVGDTLSKIAACFNTLPVVVISMLMILLA